MTDLQTQVSRPDSDYLQTPNFPPNFLNEPIANHDLIIGLYEGGVTYHCNVYHPGGNCQMRSLDTAKFYCHVCRYVLVDHIDPTLHSKIDKMYNGVYKRI